MKKVLLIHNPTAGDAAHDKKALTDELRKAGYEAAYFSTKKSWKEIPRDVELTVIAGGDGTVRKAVVNLVEEKHEVLKKPFAILPLGTANNIATTLGISGNTREIIASWESAKEMPFHLSSLESGHEMHCLLEGAGCGVFPYHIQNMIKNPTEDGLGSQERMQVDLQRLLKSISTYKPDYCELLVDGLDHSGKYLLIEAMNIKCVGTNLFLSPAGDPFDDKLDLVLMKETDKEKFANYVYSKIMGKEFTLDIEPILVSRVSFRCEHNLYHVDDELIKNKDNSLLHVQAARKTVSFLVTERPTFAEAVVG